MPTSNISAGALKSARTLLRNEVGSMTVMWALMLPVIIGSVGLAVDTGVWYSDMRRQQSATDATALTVVRSITAGTTQASLQAIANTEAARNGFTNGSNYVTITVTYPPTSGSYSGDTNAAALTIARPQNRLFSIFALNSDPSVSTRAVAVNFTNSSGSACMLSLAPSGGSTINMNGNMTLNMSGCTIASNSTNSSAININGNATINAYQLYSAGGIHKNGNYHINNTAADVTNGTAVTDPYSSLAVPSFSGCDYNSKSINGNFGTVTLSEGVYCNGLDINGTGTVNLNPGTYIIDRQTFGINGNVTVNGTGVTIILTSSTGSSYAVADINGNTTVNLSAPSSNDSSGSVTGNYTGILFYRDRNASAQTFSWNGNAAMNLTGTMYFPNDTFSHNGNASNTSTCSQIVARTININGNANMTSSCAGTGVSPISVGTSGIKLAE